MRDITRLERKKGMPYLSSFERRGMERGRHEALCSLVGSQLAKRFGALPQTVQERLRCATPAELQAWGEAVLDSPTLDSVFARR